MNKKIHIVHVIPTLSFGGAERFVVDLVNNLDRKKFCSTIITLSNNNPLGSEVKNADIVVVPKKGKVSLHLFNDLERVFKRIKPDIVHTNLFGGDFWARVSAYKVGIPVVTTEHNINVGEGLIKKIIKRHIKNYSKAYSCPSKAIQSFMKKSYGISKNIDVIRYGIDLSKFLSIKSIPNFEKDLRLLIVGRLSSQKGHITALKALKQLKDYPWKLDIVGDGEDKKKIEKKILSFGLSGRVNIHKSTKNVQDVYSKTDVLLVPSHWEGLGRVVMEGMASERLIIASRTGGIPEMVDNEKNGFLVKARSVKEIKSALKNIFEHPEIGKGIANRARVKAGKEFGMDKMVESYENIYNKIIKSR